MTTLELLSAIPVGIFIGLILARFISNSGSLDGPSGIDWVKTAKDIEKEGNFDGLRSVLSDGFISRLNKGKQK